MGQALFHNPQGQPHFLRKLAVLLHEHDIEGADKYNHAQGVHGYHGKCNQPHQFQGSWKWL